MEDLKFYPEILKQSVVGVFTGRPRSPAWPRIRAQHIKECKECAACCRTTDLEVHHIIPFHIDKEKELEATNLMTLCRMCHYFIGHLKDWSNYNKFVVNDAQVYRSRIIESVTN